MKNAKEVEKVFDRIEPAANGEVINLTGAEKDLCDGAGLRIARFDAGQLVELFNPEDVAYRNEEEKEDDIRSFLQDTEASIWQKSPNSDEVYLVRLGGHQLCDLISIDTSSHAAVNQACIAISQS